MNQQKQKLDPGVAYILWAFGLMGFNGLHRFYSGKITSGLVYFATLGFFGIGQFVDLFLIPGMVKERNIYLLHEATVQSHNNGSRVTLVKQEKKEVDPMLTLLQAAAKHNNVLSVGQAMLSTEFPIEKVQPLLDKAIKQGLAHVDNDEETGAMRYYFDV
ncbi:NINE protein [Waterburya agarophytonicola K14]|uniref:NINE protein n=1 Tax=Waterburya agarophytonicola KI4 TaxID=2874699 RepID=A0A964FED1_9CYAN|nr:NINE protein [Waterburya agarophytonicola]MCC0175961.1 NINE protein [Waterburya agarophytonicola KI4]